MKTIRLTKDGKFQKIITSPNECDHIDPKDLQDAVLYNLFESLEIEKGTKVKDFLTAIMPLEDTLDYFCDGWMKPLLTEYRQGISLREDEEDEDNIELDYLNIYKYFEYEKYGDGDSSIDECVTVSLREEGSTTSWATIGYTLFDLKDMEIRLDDTTVFNKTHYPPSNRKLEDVEDIEEFFNDRDVPEKWNYVPYMDEKVKVTYSVIEVIRAVFYELSFYGLSSETRSFLDELKDRTEEVKQSID